MIAENPTQIPATVDPVARPTPKLSGRVVASYYNPLKRGSKK